MSVPSDSSPADNLPTDNPSVSDIVAIKFVVAGGFGVGKTTFIGAVSEVRPLTTEAVMTAVSEGVDDTSMVASKITTTVALDFGRITIDPTLILYLFGTPGQERFGFMWNDLAVGAAGGIALVDTRRIDDSFVAIDWFEARGIPFVVAVNQFEGSDRFSLDEVRDALGIAAVVPLIDCDARQRSDVKNVLLAMVGHLMESARAGVPV